MNAIPRTLTRRYVLFITLVIGLLILGSFLLTSAVVKSGLIDLFRQRLVQTASVVEQYESAHLNLKQTELESIVSSPRFLAAVETGDPETIGMEARSYERLLQAKMFVVVDTSYRLLYHPEPVDQALLAKTHELLRTNESEFNLRFLTIGTELLEFSMTRILANSGEPIGWLAVGKPYSNMLVNDLKRLTGFDVALCQSERLLAFSAGSSGAIRALFASGQLGIGESEQIQQIASGSEDIVCAGLQNKSLGARIVFLASIDEHVAPIRSQMMLLLGILAVAGVLLSIIAVWVFTTRKIGRQVDLLVDSAQRIGAGELDFKIRSISRDELGFLAETVEQMRARILADREQLDLATRERIEAERLATVGRMAAGIVHDFKNPMAIIRGTADLLQLGKGGPEKVAKHCTTISNQIDRMNELARDILEYSRGQSNLELRPTPLASYVDSIYQFHKAAFEHAGIKFVAVDSIPVVMRLDGNRFRRVADNILNNAREALKPGQTVWILWRVDRQQVTIEIKDNGPGIPEAIRETLFEPFVTSNKSGGTGLGLAIAKKIVDDHGATINVQSSAIDGTNFQIVFPATMICDDSDLRAHEPAKEQMESIA